MPTSTLKRQRKEGRKGRKEGRKEEEKEGSVLILRTPRWTNRVHLRYARVENGPQQPGGRNGNPRWFINHINDRKRADALIGSSKACRHVPRQQVRRWNFKMTLRTIVRAHTLIIISLSMLRSVSASTICLWWSEPPAASSAAVAELTD
jgi:hypothetical protein